MRHKKWQKTSFCDCIDYLSLKCHPSKFTFQILDNGKNLFQPRICFLDVRR